MTATNGSGVQTQIELRRTYQKVDLLMLVGVVLVLRIPGRIVNR